MSYCTFCWEKWVLDAYIMKYKPEGPDVLVFTNIFLKMVKFITLTAKIHLHEFLISI